MVLSFCDSWCRQWNERYLYRDVRYQYNQQSSRCLRHCIESATKSAYTFSELYIIDIAPNILFPTRERYALFPSAGNRGMVRIPWGFVKHAWCRAYRTPHRAFVWTPCAAILPIHFWGSLFHISHLCGLPVHLVHPLKIKCCNIKKSPNCNPENHLPTIHLHVFGWTKPSIVPGCFSKIPVLNLGLEKR